jgi:hypothetical protein
MATPRAAANSPAAAAARMMAGISTSRLPFASDSGPNTSNDGITSSAYVANSSVTTSRDNPYTVAYSGNSGVGRLLPAGNTNNAQAGRRKRFPLLQPAGTARSAAAEGEPLFAGSFARHGWTAMGRHRRYLPSKNASNQTDGQRAGMRPLTTSGRA